MIERYTKSESDFHLYVKICKAIDKKHFFSTK